jgi:hypothetical protein
MFIYLVLQFGLMGDGVTTTWNLNLKSDPYFVLPVASAGTLQPGFKPQTKLPTAVFGGSGNPSETISGSILTITYSAPPASGPFTQGVIVEYVP